MSFKGTFEKRNSTKVNGIYSFTSTNGDWLGSETFIFLQCDAAGQQPWYYREQKLKASEAIRFDFDTMDRSWCQGELFAILGRKDKIENSWQLRLKEYRPGKCPQCHDSHKCGHRNSNGCSFGFNTSVSQCPYCEGTGIC